LKSLTSKKSARVALRAHDRDCLTHCAAFPVYHVPGGYCLFSAKPGLIENVQVSINPHSATMSSPAFSAPLQTQVEAIVAPMELSLKPNERMPFQANMIFPAPQCKPADLDFVRFAFFPFVQIPENSQRGIIEKRSKRIADFLPYDCGIINSGAE